MGSKTESWVARRDAMYGAMRNDGYPTVAMSLPIEYVISAEALRARYASFYGTVRSS